MKKFFNYIKSNWLLYFIACQPIIDFIAYFQTKTLGVSFSWIIRIICLVIVTLIVFFNSKNKKKLILYLSPFIIYFIAHIFNLYRINSLNMLLDLKYFVLVFQMPILTILLIDYIKNNYEKISLIKKGMAFSLIIIAIIIFLSFITNSYEITYEYSKTGIIGWFTGSNTPSMILCALCPWFVYYFSTKKNNYLFFIMCALAFALLYFNATKACYITLITSFVILLFGAIISKKKEDKAQKIVILFFFTVMSLFLYRYSFTAINRNMAIENIEANSSEIQKITDNNTETLTTESENKTENIINQNEQSYSDEEILKILKISHIYAELIDLHGEEKVINAMRNHLSPEDLANNRLLKIINAKIESESADLITNFLGNGYSKFVKNDYDLETDLNAIYYYYGYIGFGIYIVFIAYFVLKLIIKILKQPSIIRDNEYIILCYLVPLLIFGGEYSGAFLRKPNANIYLSLFLLLAYFKCANLQKNKNNAINNKYKISFLCLHLGYGGIETATINSANALVDDYDVEIISFYNLKDNQALLLNKNIKIKYLCQFQPNKEKFIQSLHDHSIVNIFREGIIATRILIQKRLKIINEIKNSDANAIVSTRYTFSVLLSKFGSNDIIKIAQEHHHHNNDKKYISIIKNKYNNIDYLCALTNSLKKDYELFLQKNKHTKIILLPNILSIESISHSKLNKKNIICVGRLNDGKRINELIEIFSEIENKKSKFYIVGEGEEGNALKKLVKNLNLKDRVIFTGYLSHQEQTQYYLDSSIFVMASISEGLPMVLLEAMQYGLPCIAYETESGVNDIISNNTNGYVIKNRNKKDFISKIDKLFSDKELLKKLSDNAINTTKKFNKDKVIKLWKKMLEK